MSEDKSIKKQGCFLFPCNLFSVTTYQFYFDKCFPYIRVADQEFTPPVPAPPLILSNVALTVPEIVAV